jgi:hypothetical protein
MAQILSFRTPEFRDGEATSRHQGHSAEVILFPGVRYERWAERDTASISGERGASRDVLELADQ